MVEAAAERSAGQARAQRRRRVEGGRRNQVLVRFSDEEFASVSAKARAARLSLPALVASAAINLTRGEEDASGRLAPHEVRALIIELFAIRRGMANAGRNINDVNRFALGTGRLKEDTEAAVRELRAATERLDAFLAHVADYLPGVDLTRTW
jgi:hypothetical protein